MGDFYAKCLKISLLITYSNVEIITDATLNIKKNLATVPPENIYPFMLLFIHLRSLDLIPLRR